MTTYHDTGDGMFMAKSAYPLEVAEEATDALTRFHDTIKALLDAEHEGVTGICPICGRDCDGTPPPDGGMTVMQYLLGEPTTEQE